jgi:hypothetical protein
MNINKKIQGALHSVKQYLVELPIKIDKGVDGHHHKLFIENKIKKLTNAQQKVLFDVAANRIKDLFEKVSGIPKRYFKKFDLHFAKLQVDPYLNEQEMKKLYHTKMKFSESNYEDQLKLVSYIIKCDTGEDIDNFDIYEPEERYHDGYDHSTVKAFKVLDDGVYEEVVNFLSIPIKNTERLFEVLKRYPELITPEDILEVKKLKSINPQSLSLPHF